MLREARSLTRNHTTTQHGKSRDIKTSGPGLFCVPLPSQFQTVKKKTMQTVERIFAHHLQSAFALPYNDLLRQKLYTHITDERNEAWR